MTQFSLDPGQNVPPYTQLTMKTFNKQLTTVLLDFLTELAIWEKNKNKHNSK
jgi:hypothetical protein